MTKKNVYKTKKQSGQLGFTLLEMSLVLLIVALLTVPLMNLYNSHLENQKLTVTKENVKKAISAMATADPRFMPCPSDRSLPPTDPNFGHENCNLAAIPNCNAGGTPVQGICRVRGSRDTNADGNDWVIIGGVPITIDIPGATTRTTILKGENSIDGWGRLLNYAISERVSDHTNTTGADNFKYGVISAIDEIGNATAGINGDAEFVIWSAGKNGAGAYQYLGGPVAPCPVGNRDSENCNNDFTFRQALGVYEGAGANYFDDISYFYLQGSGDLWSYAAARTAGAPEQHIYNLNKDAVLIGTNVTGGSGARLIVNGNLEAATAKAQFFSAGGQASFSPNGIPLVGDRACSGSNVLQSWNTLPPGNPNCGQPSIMARGISYTRTCPAGSLVKGITTRGCVLCTNGVELCP